MKPVFARDVSISVGVGRHQAVDASAMRRRVGDEIVARYRAIARRSMILPLTPTWGRLPGRSRKGVPAGGAGRPANSGWLGLASSSGRIRRRIQAHFPREPATAARWGRFIAMGSQVKPMPASCWARTRRLTP